MYWLPMGRYKSPTKSGRPSLSVLRYASPKPELAYTDDACFRGDAPSKPTRPTTRMENAAQAVRFAQCNVGKFYSGAHGEPCECGERSTPLTAPLIFCKLLCRSLFHDFMLPRQPPFRPIIPPIPFPCTSP